MLQKMVGVVLHTLKYNDTSSIVDIYTREVGRASFLIKVKRTKKSGASALLFQPLALVEFETDLRATKNLHPIKEAKSWYLFCSLPYHPFKSAIAMFLAEFLYRALKEQEPDEALFAYLYHSILWLDSCENKNFANFHLVFLIRLSRFLGLYPNIEHYRPNAYFDMVNACFTMGVPASGLYLQPAEAAAIVNLMRMNYDNMHLFAMNRLERNRCLTLINDYYRLHIPDFPVLKSIDILKELFS